MKLLKTISNQDFGLAVQVEAGQKTRMREAARAIVLDGSYKIALLFVSKKNYYTLPGGGLEENESIIQALEREILEETGCRVEVMTEIGEIKEHRENYLLTQKSYCYSVKVVGEKGEPVFTDKEKDAGFQLKWCSLDDAIKIMVHNKLIDYRGHFIQLRDLTFLKAFAKQIELNG
jgi:8-oxo-dGTP pyrophosphatase MutT (NUDIX family)